MCELNYFFAQVNVDFVWGCVCMCLCAECVCVYAVFFFIEDQSIIKCVLHFYLASEFKKIVVFGVNSKRVNKCPCVRFKVLPLIKT